MELTKARLISFSETFSNSSTLEIDVLYTNKIPSSTGIVLQIATD